MENFLKFAVQFLLPLLICVLGSGWFADWLKDRREKKEGRATTDQIIEAIGNLKAEIDQERAVTARVRIIRFNDEILSNQRHSKESFDQCLSDIDTYESYCHEHPNFKNNKTVMSTENIKRCYRDCEQQHDFL